MYWVKKDEKGGEGFDMQAIAVGSEQGKERNEKICRIQTTFPESVTTAPKAMNGHAGLAKPELLTAPTETDLPSTLKATSTHPTSPLAKEAEEAKVEEQKQTGNEDVKVVVQNGETVPASRLEPVTFVTAQEVATLNEKTGGLDLNGDLNGVAKGPHVTDTANKLDPSVPTNIEGKAGEKVGL